MQYLLRHGETNFNRDGLIQGHSMDSVLTEKGNLQMVNVAADIEKLCPFPHDVVCSDLTRAKQSYQIINSILRFRKVCYSQLLREQDQGELAGLSYISSEVALKVPVETLESLEARVMAYITSIDYSKTCLHITHGGWLAALVNKKTRQNWIIPNGGLLALDGSIIRPLNF